jgi:Cdc6-like AAA superfamily ATPase
VNIYDPDRETRLIYRSNVSFATKYSVDRLHQRQDDRDRREKHHEILDWLSHIDYAAQHSDFASRRQEGTGQWLLGAQQFRAWVGQRNQTLFCPGIPGAGKTMSAAIVIDNLYAEFYPSANIGIAYIYCNFRRHYEQNLTDLLASLAKQLIQALPSVPQSIQRLYEQHYPKRTRLSLNEISQVLQSAVLNYSKAFIVIDALDECQSSGGARNQLLAELFNLQAKTAVNLFVTSRFIPEIEKEFAGRSMQLKIRAKDEDLQRYVDGRILCLPSFVSRSMVLQNEIKTAIINAVDGMCVSSCHQYGLIGLTRLGSCSQNSIWIH